MASTTFSGAVTSTNGFVGALTGDVTGTILATAPINVTAATLTVTQATHAGRTVTLNRAAGITATLPAATGTGSEYTFVVSTTVTSNNNIIKVANATDVINGLANVFSDNAAAAMIGFLAAPTDDTITLNGTTKGGILGDKIVIIDVASGKFHALVNTSATGTEATPFSATVS